MCNLAAIDFCYLYHFGFLINLFSLIDSVVADYYLISLFDPDQKFLDWSYQFDLRDNRWVLKGNHSFNQSAQLRQQELAITTVTRSYEQAAFTITTTTMMMMMHLLASLDFYFTFTN